MTAISETAPAKINLYLHVGPLRDDGLHDLASLFVFTEEGDEIIAEPADELSLKIEGPFASALAGDPIADNLVIRAAKALQAKWGVKAGAKLTLVKNLPVAAGVGGGSADAAAALRALTRLWRLSPFDAGLHDLAFGLGADVPACLERKPVLVDGAGEKLSASPSLPPLQVLLVNPGIEMPTGPVFRRFDAQNLTPRLPAHPHVDFDSVGAARTLMKHSRNDLEAPAFAIAPEIEELVKDMAASPGAVAARMSGSGATCFALFENKRAAENARAQFAKKKYWTMASALASG